MDLLKNLQNLAVHDKKETNQQPQPTTTAAPASGSLHHAPAPVSTQSVEPWSTTDKLFSKINDTLGGPHSSLTSSTPVTAPALKPVESQSTTDKLLSTINDKLGGSHNSLTPTLAPAVRQSNTDKLFSKIGEVVSGKPATPSPAPASVAQLENIFDKIGDKLSGRKTPPPPKEENLVGKLAHKITGKHDEATPPKNESISDKINSVLGGGKRAESKEDKLDKAIDMFQEHILKEGPQDNESPWEQAKDRKIANYIRTTFGQEKK